MAEAKSTTGRSPLARGRRESPVFRDPTPIRRAPVLSVAPGTSLGFWQEDLSPSFRWSDGAGFKTRTYLRRPRASGDLPVVDLASAISVSQRPPRPRRRRPREWRFEISSPRRGPMNKKPGNIGISCRKTEVFPYSGDPIPSPRIPGGGRGLGPSTYWTSIGAMRACLDEVGRLPGSPIGTRQSRRKQETGYWDRRRTG